MCKFFLFLTLMISTALIANEESIFRNEDSGLVVQIPEDAKRTWSLVNHEWDLDLSIFSEGHNLGRAILIATVPMESEIAQIKRL